MQYAARNLADDRGDTIHVLHVVLQQERCEQPTARRKVPQSVLVYSYWVLTHKLAPASSLWKLDLQDQELFSWQYGALLRQTPHKLHIVRVVHRGGAGDRPSAAAYVARAICVKAEQLRSSGVCPPLNACCHARQGGDCFIKPQLAALLQSSWWGASCGYRRLEPRAAAR